MSDARRFFGAVENLYLYQLVHSPTGSREGCCHSRLDLVLSSEELTVDAITEMEPLGKSNNVVMISNFLKKKTVSGAISYTRVLKHGNVGISVKSILGFDVFRIPAPFPTKRHTISI